MTLLVMASKKSGPSPSLADLLRNRLIFHQISPYLDITTLLSLAATSKGLRCLVYQTPQAFQYLDLSTTCQKLGSYGLTYGRDGCYSKPLNDALIILGKYSVLQSVRTLILDGVNVPSNYLLDLLNSRINQIRILSLRRVGMLSDDQFQRILRHIIRPSRPSPQDWPKLRAVYWFGDTSSTVDTQKDAKHMPNKAWSDGITMRSGARLGAGSQTPGTVTTEADPYAQSVYSSIGACIKRRELQSLDEWAIVLNNCQGIIAFDMVLCSHDSLHPLTLDPTPKLATIRLSGCEICGSCPEGAAYPGISVCYLTFN